MGSEGGLSQTVISERGSVAGQADAGIGETTARSRRGPGRTHSGSLCSACLHGEESAIGRHLSCFGCKGRAGHRSPGETSLSSSSVRVLNDGLNVMMGIYIFMGRHLLFVIGSNTQN